LQNGLSRAIKSHILFKLPRSLRSFKSRLSFSISLGHVCHMKYDEAALSEMADDKLMNK
jgi:hypothetical protein